MITFPAKAWTDADGTLSLAISTGLPDAEVDVVAVVEPAGRDVNVPSDEWPEGYFARNFGSLRDAGLERPPQEQLQDSYACIQFLNGRSTHVGRRLMGTKPSNISYVRS
ncbi:MAG TPA: hypothetical protein VNY05_41665 [Candidatus Acidoferrales bacterium]|jgi:hypothetical protein|nr:hypothetical protein [Candidatus Acidoferrales bacterium]